MFDTHAAEVNDDEVQDPETDEESQDPEAPRKEKASQNNMAFEYELTERF